MKLIFILLINQVFVFVFSRIGSIILQNEAEKPWLLFFFFISSSGGFLTEAIRKKYTILLTGKYNIYVDIYITDAVLYRKAGML